VRLKTMMNGLGWPDPMAKAGHINTSRSKSSYFHKVRILTTIGRYLKRFERYVPNDKITLSDTKDRGKTGPLEVSYIFCK